MGTDMGQVLERAVRKKGHNISQLARLLGVNRRTIYHWFAQQELSLAIVDRLGRAINHDFSAELPELYKENTDTETSTAFLSIEEFKAKEQYWKDKYITLLERYVELLSDGDPCP